MIKEMEDIVNTLGGVDCESTRAPYWLIIDPYRQMFDLDIHTVASMISGPFFCRKDAQDYFESRRYHFSKHAKVYCHSGHFSKKYENLCKKLDKV